MGLAIYPYDLEFRKKFPDKQRQQRAGRALLFNMLIMKEY